MCFFKLDRQNCQEAAANIVTSRAMQFDPSRFKELKITLPRQPVLGRDLDWDSCIRGRWTPHQKDLVELDDGASSPLYIMLLGKTCLARR